MRLSESIQVAFLLVIGVILHYIVPPLMLGMKPDPILAMLFIAILMHRNVKVTLEAGIIGGIFAALTSTFPGGQIANIIDKIITSFFVLALIKALSGKVNDKVLSGIIGAVGTLASGAIFLLSALLIVGLPGPFKALYATVVLPTALLNTIAVVILYPLALFSQRAVQGSRPAGQKNTRPVPPIS